MTGTTRLLGSGVLTGTVAVNDATGLHARPSVKLTRLAKRFRCMIEIASSPDGPWVDAKSPVKVLRLKIPHQAVLHVRCSGDDASQALAEVVGLVRDGFPNGIEPRSRRPAEGADG